MIAVTYLPHFRLTEVGRYFARNVEKFEGLNLKDVLIFVDDYGVGDRRSIITYIDSVIGNRNPTVEIRKWRDRNKCVLDMLRYLKEHTNDDITIIDSDVEVARIEGLEDLLKELKVLHMTDAKTPPEVLANPRRFASLGNRYGYELYCTPVRYRGRFFVGPKLCMMWNRQVVKRFNENIIRDLKEVMSDMLFGFSMVLPDEWSLAAVFYHSGIKYTYFINNAIHVRAYHSRGEEPRLSLFTPRAAVVYYISRRMLSRGYTGFFPVLLRSIASLGYHALRGH